MKVLSTLFALIFSSLSFATTLNNLVVFGDSLSDTGNFYEYMNKQLPQSPPYYKGHFCNGPVWAEYLLDSYYKENASAHLLNYAFGGAGVSEEDEDVLFTFKRELDIYLTTHQGKADDNSLYVVWIGANNYLGIPDDMTTAVNEVSDGIDKGLQRLIKAGAKHILLINAPNLGTTPFANGFDAKEQLDAVSKLHNQMIFEKYLSARQNQPEIDWLFYDVNARLDEVLVNPLPYGITNVADTCYDSLVEKATKNSAIEVASLVRTHNESSNCKGYLFFDPVHPTTVAHKVIGEDIRILFDNSGIEFLP